MDELAKFLAEIETFLVTHDMDHTVFARAATRDTSYVARLRKGSGTGVRTMIRVRAWMAAYKPPKNSKRAAAQVAA